MDRSLPGFSIHGISQARILEWVAVLPFPSQGGFLHPGIEPMSPALQADSFTTKPPGEHTTTTTTKSLHSCPTLCDPIDSSPPGSSIPGILQLRTLEWVAISFSNALK